MIFELTRSIRFAWQHIWRNLWLSIVTLFLLVLTTLSITLVAGLNVVGRQVITVVQQKVDVDFYFYEYVSEKDILRAQDFLKSLSQTQSVQYTSADAALKDFTERHKDDPAILATLSELEQNVLPASLTVKAEKISAYPSIISAFKASEFQEMIDRTDYSDNSELVQKINTATSVANRVALIVSVIFLFISVVVIFNTFRITIYSYREEIGIMKLVGATNNFIRSPFIMEGILLGAISAGATLIVSAIVLVVSDDAVRTFFGGYNFSLLAYAQAHWWQFIVSEFLGAILLSVLFTMIAISRYLKV